MTIAGDAWYTRPLYIHRWFIRSNRHNQNCYTCISLSPCVSWLCWNPLIPIEASLYRF